MCQTVNCGKMEKNRKAQLKIQQMAFMLLAVTLFFVFVGLFAIILTFSGLRDSAENLGAENAALLVSRLANSPEFSCGFSFDETKVACVDSDKVMMLKENIGRYAGFWGKDVSDIEIRKIYPRSDFPENPVECTIQNYPECDIMKVLSSSSGELSGNFESNFVSLCRKSSFEGEIYNKCEIARLMVSYESK